MGEKAAWIVFCLTSLQLAFLSPYVIVIPGDRANVFSAILCAVSLVVALAFRRKDSVCARPSEIVISLVLLVLVVLSGLFSLTPGPSSVRGFTILASGLGGFWCARILLASRERQRHFQWLCIFLLCGILVLSAASMAIKRQHLSIRGFALASCSRPAHSAFLCPAGPAECEVTLGCGGCSALALCQLHNTLVRGPDGCNGVGRGYSDHFFAFLPRFFGNGGSSKSSLLLLVMFAVSLAAGNHFFYQDPNLVKKWERQGESVAYRAESIFFSWKIATDHPLLGIGLLAPRDEILENYQPRYPYISKETFVQWTHRLRTSENMFFTFLADLGFPFTIIYTASVIFLLFNAAANGFPPAG